MLVNIIYGDFLECELLKRTKKRSQIHISKKTRRKRISDSGYILLQNLDKTIIV